MSQRERERERERERMASGGTEAFPELGKHCQNSSCNQLDFLPFKCDACQKVYCAEHRSYKSHECPKADELSRMVLVCSLCSMSIAKKDGEEKMVMAQHQKSGDCNPSNKKKPKCPVLRCKQVLTFSNTTTCKTCIQKVCLKHRFPSDHNCSSSSSNKSATANASTSSGSKFLAALAASSSKKCGQEKHMLPSSPVKAY